ncbi:MAG: hypothetical protein ACREDV_07445, partial [Methylocella sp.]
NRPFSLKALEPAQLDWFIAVEKASPNAGGGDNTIDGMYVNILKNIEASNEFNDDEKERFRQLVKVIIDESQDHYLRFAAVKAGLAGLDPESYLLYRDPVLAPASGTDRLLQETVDAAYVVVLKSLEFVFKMGDRNRGTLMESARKAMFNMDDGARLLSERGHTPMFDMSEYEAALAAAVIAQRAMTRAARAASLKAAAESVADPLGPRLASLGTTADPALVALAERMRWRSETMTREFIAAAEAERT